MAIKFEEEPKPKFRRPLAKDRHKTISAQKPWEKEGISRRTWYRWKRAKAKPK